MTVGVRERILAAGLLVAVAAAGVFAVLLYNLRDANNAARQPEQAIAAASRLETLVLDLETGRRGYVITGQPRFLEPWRAALVALPGQEAALERLVRDDPRQEATARAITRAVRSYVDGYARPLVATARRNRAKAELGRQDAGKRRVDAIRGQVATFTAAENRARRHSPRTTRSSAATLTIAVGAAGVVGVLLFILLLAGYLTRAIVIPARRLSAAAVLLTPRRPRGARARHGNDRGRRARARLQRDGGQARGEQGRGRPADRRGRRDQVRARRHGLARAPHAARERGRLHGAPAHEGGRRGNPGALPRDRPSRGVTADRADRRLPRPAEDRSGRLLAPAASPSSWAGCCASRSSSPPARTPATSCGSRFPSGP